MATVRFARRVAADLRRIAEWIGRDDPARAISFVNELRQACLDLADFPRAYPPFPALGPQARRRNHGNYAILYRVDDRDVVTVQIIVHAARQLEDLA